MAELPSLFVIVPDIATLASTGSTSAATSILHAGVAADTFDAVCQELVLTLNLGCLQPWLLINFLIHCFYVFNII